MVYLWQVVHRRLAARNILLDNLYEPKITGFGPEPENKETEDDTESVSLTGQQVDTV